MKNFILSVLLFTGSLIYCQNTSDQTLNLSEETSENGVITRMSKLSFEKSYAKLKQALEQNEAISIMAEVDHQKNASGVDMKMNPARLIIFGNPNLGTPLMQENTSIALDLPQKMLIWENENGKVMVSYNDPYYIAERHSVEQNDKLLDKISSALTKLSSLATGN